MDSITVEHQVRNSGVTAAQLRTPHLVRPAHLHNATRAGMGIEVSDPPRADAEVP